MLNPVPICKGIEAVLDTCVPPYQYAQVMYTTLQEHYVCMYVPT